MGGLDALLARPRPSTWQQFLKEPCVFLAKKLYSWRSIIPIEPISPITVVCVSDTHNSQPRIPPGDILIHAGDATQSGTLKEFQSCVDWLHSLPHKYKILVAGNHDLLLDPKIQSPDSTRRDAIDWQDVIYLHNEAITLRFTGGRQLKIYGSPLSPRHGNWAFQYSRAQDVWRDAVPIDTDVLVTHGPPRTHLDLGYLGCCFLLRELWSKRPRLHVFGHVHEGYGQEWVQFDGLQKAYEETLISNGGIWRLGRVLYEFLLTQFRPNGECQALLVNASAVGGLRDEKRRQAITVHI